MNKRERIYAALEGEPVDRVPLSLWRNFHKQDQTVTGLASATLALYEQYDFDLIKLTPSDYYAVEDWGAQIIYSKKDDQPPQLKKSVIKKPEDWQKLGTLNIGEGLYGQALETIKLIKTQLGKEDAPLFMTIFSPLTLAYKLATETLLSHLETHATDVHIGLATIAETTSRFANAVLDAGAEGIFFASHLSRPDMVTEEMCQTFIVPYDLIALERVSLMAAPTVLHLHGSQIYFDTVAQYPVHAVSWHNHQAGPPLSDALNLTDKALMTGLDTDLIERGQPEEIAAQGWQAIQETRGNRFILAPDCAISPATPPQNLEAIKNMDRQLG